MVVVVVVVVSLHYVVSRSDSHSDQTSISACVDAACQLNSHKVRCEAPCPTQGNSKAMSAQEGCRALDGTTLRDQQ